jgi:RNase P protein component
VKRAVREFFRTHGELLGARDYNVLIPGHKKIEFPYPQKLRRTLEHELVPILKKST